MSSLNPSEYRKRVIAPLAESSTGELPDLFALLDLDLDIEDQDAIEERIRLVVGFWRKDNSPKTKGISSVLLAREHEIRDTILDPGARASLRQVVLAKRQADRAAKAIRLREAIALLEDHFGGVPRSKRATLVQIALNSGLSETDLDYELSSVRVIDDGAGGFEVLPEVQRTQIRGSLRELGHLRADIGGARTLFGFLGVTSSASVDEIQQAHREQVASNRRRRADREKTLVGELLTFSRLFLIEGDRSTYTNGLVLDLKDELRREIETFALIGDHIPAAEVERMVREGVVFIGDVVAARRAVSELAREAHVGLDMPRAVDYVTCSHCGKLEPEGGNDDCRGCMASLYIECGSCAGKVEASARVCPLCRADLSALSEALARLSDARLAIAVGCIAEARSHVVAARVIAPSLEAIRPIDEALLVLERQLRTTLQEIGQAIRENRIAWAKKALDSLSLADMQDPDRDSANQHLYLVNERMARAEKLVVAAESAKGTLAEEIHLRSALEIVVDSDSIRRRLEAIPPAPPSGVKTVVGDQSVQIGWMPSSVDIIRYEIRRTLEGGNCAVIGQSSSSTFYDLSPPAGALFRYEVLAVRGSARSNPARSDTVSFTPEVKDLTGVAQEGSVQLRWQHALAGQVVIERNEQGAPVPVRRMYVQRGVGADEAFLDAEVRNGTTYEYRIHVEYKTDSGSVTRTPGLLWSGRPGVRLSAIDDLACVVQPNGSVVFSWDRPSIGNVSVVRLAGDATPPPMGAAFNPSRLQDMGVVLSALGSGACDETLGSGCARYLPVTIHGDEAIVGSPIWCPPFGDIADVVVTTDGYGFDLSWVFPPYCHDVVIAVGMWQEPTLTFPLYIFKNRFPNVARLFPVVRPDCFDWVPMGGDRPVQWVTVSSERTLDSIDHNESREDRWDVPLKASRQVQGDVAAARSRTERWGFLSPRAGKRTSSVVDARAVAPSEQFGSDGHLRVEFGATGLPNPGCPVYISVFPCFLDQGEVHELRAGAPVAEVAVWMENSDTIFEVR